MQAIVEECLVQTELKPLVIPTSLLLPYQSCDSLPLIFIIMRGSRPVKGRKLTPQNSITSQYGEINLSILRQLQAAVQEDPLQDLTSFLESKLLFYQRSLKKIHISTEPAARQNVASADTGSTPRQAKYTSSGHWSNVGSSCACYPRYLRFATSVYSEMSRAYKCQCMEVQEESPHYIT